MKHLFAGLAIAGFGLAGAAMAESHMTPDMLKAAHEARDHTMSLYAFNIATLGAMAKGAMEYDAAAAKAAAGNIAKLASQNQMAYWPKGSGVGEVEGSRVKPELWDNMDDVMAKQAALTDAAMKAEASTDLASLQAAMGDLGKACGSCHQAYRAPE